MNYKLGYYIHKTNYWTLVDENPKISIAPSSPLYLHKYFWSCIRYSDCI